MNNDKLPDWNEEPIYKSEPNKEKPDLTTFQQLVDDLVDTRWTMTIGSWLLRSNGSGPVYPLALAYMGWRTD